MTSEESKDTSRRKKKRSRRPRIEKVVARNIAVTSVHRRLLALAVISTFLAVAIVMVAFSIATRKVPPQYIPVASDGTLLELQPVSQPNMDDARVIEFSLKALRAINTYDYINYRDQFQLAQDYFTTAGWNAYLQDYESVGTIRAVTERKQIVSVRPNGAGKIVATRRGPAGEHMWHVEIPAVISYTAHNNLSGANTGSNKQVGRAVFFVARVPNTIHPDGVLLASYGFIID